MVMDMKGSAQFFHIEVFKVTSMVTENGKWDSEVTYDMIEDKLGHLKSYGSDKGDYFYPLSEIIYGGDYPLVSF